MALFEWKHLNSKVVVTDTRKKYFSQYYCSIKYFCPGGRVINNPSSDIDIAEIIEARKLYGRRYNYGGSWRASLEQLDSADVSQLLAMREVKKKYANLIKVRIEEPTVIMYARDESTLVDISYDLSNWHDKLRQVTRPSDDAAKLILDNGSIIVKRDPGYLYKVLCKEGICENKSSITAYLINLDDQVKISKTVLKTMSMPGKYIWGIWFYTNDPSIGNMLNIIEPNFVTNIHKVVQA